MEGVPRLPAKAFVINVGSAPVMGAVKFRLLQKRGLPVGVLYNDESRPSFDQQLDEIRGKARERTVDELIGAFEF